MTEPEVFEVLRKLRYDLTAAQAKLSEALGLLAEMNLPMTERPVCPDCGVAVKGERSLAEHRYHAHEGPEPQHWLEAERLAG